MNIRNVKGDRYYGRAAKLYQKKRERGTLWHIEQEAVADMLGGLPDGLKVVDVPFGTGRFVPYYIEHGYEIYGLDASNEMIAQSKEELGAETYGKCHLEVGYSTELPYEDKQFDLVVSSRFLRDIIHFGPGKKTLREFARVTKSYAIIQMGQQIDPTDDYPKDNERMGSRLTGAEIEALLDETGFVLKDKTRVSHEPEENSEIYFYLCHLKS